MNFDVVKPNYFYYHKWFAWYPVYITKYDYTTGKYVTSWKWLEYVERKLYDSASIWQGFNYKWDYAELGAREQELIDAEKEYNKVVSDFDKKRFPYIYKVRGEYVRDWPQYLRWDWEWESVESRCKSEYLRNNPSESM